MSRYSRGRVGLTKLSDERSSIGESHMETALINLNQKQQIAATTMTNAQFTRHGLIHMLINDETYNRLHAVKGLISTSDVKQYPVRGLHLHVDFDGAAIPSFEPSAVNIQQDRVAPLDKLISDLSEVHWAYEKVRGTLKWMNRNATPGAIRFYWPAAMKLTETSPIWADLQEVPTRYSNPPHIGDWLQILKDTAATVTSMILLPSDVKPREKKTMWVSFPSVRIDVGPNGQSYRTDNVIYNL